MPVIRHQTNPHSGPCWYCGKTVHVGMGVNPTGKDVVCHKDCVGSMNRTGRKFYYLEADRRGMLRDRTNLTNIQEKYMNRNPNANDHITGRKLCFILWCPTSTPVQTYDTLNEAWEVADEMARKNDGQRFLVMQSVGCSAVEKPVVRREIVEQAADSK